MLAFETRAAVGSLAPNFVVDESDGLERMLSDLRGNPVILAFCPPSWDPARASLLAHYNALVAQIPDAGARLIGISTDGVWCRLAFEHEDVKIPLLADLDPFGAIAEQFGVAGEQALVVIDAHGVIRARYSDADGSSPSTQALAAILAHLAPDPDAPRGLFELAPRSPAGTREVPDVGLNQTLSPSRREFVATTLAAACMLAAAPLVARAETLTTSATEKLVKPQPGLALARVNLNVNGRSVTLDIEPRVTLLDALREYANLTGTKKGCDHGQCGACTVHINGRRQLSCMTFAMMHQGAQITTVEGLAKGDALHPMQTAFIKHDGFQCGYCTPGQLMSATALLSEPCGSADSDVKECMSGNICRCGAYPGIVAAIQDVRANPRG